jgi:FAD/FMN-containing dehydrogenase
MNRYESWGRFPKAVHTVVRLHGREAALPAHSGAPMLPFGNGRSDGDCCLNDGGMLVDARGLDRFIAFDPATGILRCEAGVLLAEILDLVVPQGWFVPVTPGTRFVTVGGAVANDVHGKNHHRAGTFGRHVKGFELLRSDGTRLFCAPAENPEWFRASIGGLGLTGLITWVELALKRIRGPAIDEETLRFDRLEEFFRLSRESDATHEYTVAWIDCTARGESLGRGHFMRGNDAAERGARTAPAAAPARWGVPFDPPFALVNDVGLRAFNAVYFHRRGHKMRRRRVHYSAFFYPLDAIGGWNRIYGPNGLLQYQCVIPHRDAEAAIAAILRAVAAAGTGSFLAVLKVFGDLPSPGLLSFPRPGATLALDFPNLGRPTLDLLDRLDAIAMEAQGAVYPAKDARMSPDTFRRSFPHWQELEPFIDPRFSSSLWRRVTGALRSGAGANDGGSSG